ncbi:MAG: hypothetical protein A3J94_11535 [Syntrophus sp. RIFOXYC2_FULL_54_9]|nr:MAG: hypothetical protein A2X92_02715 [Syntrophus sp. GWC2_56_31]OHE26179.1 MAG: hypothetical protein A3J94_11535 [Syntrophus sp. RIFOXYC2_FULL_54_9]HBB17459.1 hypothetical protein [Syntrophus sp. (in: bacteria)]
MTKVIDLDKTVYELAEQYPELTGIMKEIGFLGIANPVMLNTMGRVMTIPKGCEKMGIDLGEVKKALREKGFEISEKVVDFLE